MFVGGGFCNLQRLSFSFRGDRSRFFGLSLGLDGKGGDFPTCLLVLGLSRLQGVLVCTVFDDADSAERQGVIARRSLQGCRVQDRLLSRGLDGQVDFLHSTENRAKGLELDGGTVELTAPRNPKWDLQSPPNIDLKPGDSIRSNGNRRLFKIRNRHRDICEQA